MDSKFLNTSTVRRENEIKVWYFFKTVSWINAVQKCFNQSPFTFFILPLQSTVIFFFRFVEFIILNIFSRVNVFRKVLLLVARYDNDDSWLMFQMWSLKELVFSLHPILLLQYTGIVSRKMNCQNGDEECRNYFWFAFCGLQYPAWNELQE